MGEFCRLIDGLIADLSLSRFALTFFNYFDGLRSVRCLAADFILRFFDEEEGGFIGIVRLESKAASSLT